MEIKGLGELNADCRNWKACFGLSKHCSNYRHYRHPPPTHTHTHTHTHIHTHSVTYILSLYSVHVLHGTSPNPAAHTHTPHTTHAHYTQVDDDEDDMDEAEEERETNTDSLITKLQDISQIFDQKNERYLQMELSYEQCKKVWYKQWCSPRPLPSPWCSAVAITV